MTRHSERGVWISLPHATFALEVNNARVVFDAPPIARWTIGKDISQVLNYFARRHGSQLIWREL